MKLKYLTSIMILLALTIVFTSYVEASEEDELKSAVTNLCAVLKSGDKAAFEALLAADKKNQMQWWWEASGKGKYFPTLFDRCEYTHLDPNATGAAKKVFVQRYDKDGKTPWGRPAPVSFQKDATGAWKVVGYSL